MCDQIKSFFNSEHHCDLVGIVRREGRISVAQLISDSTASPATIRCDINPLVAVSSRPASGKRRDHLEADEMLRTGR